METPRVIREAEAILRNNPPPWQGECAHDVGLHATLESRRLDGGPRCCRCDAVIR